MENDNVKLEKIMTIYVKVRREERIELEYEGEKQVMIPFDGYVTGKYFNGKILPGGVDTQHIDSNGVARISARYMIEFDNKDRLFIENNGVIHYKYGVKYFKTYPKFVTNSKEYWWLNTDSFIGEVKQAECGPEITFYRVV
ncbi:MAG: DUF3237 domain-containing protein [Clostridium perfringens]|nr:DUF3237 domain-containing protein [Clostridium perfringens]